MEKKTNNASKVVLLLGAMGFWVMGDNYAASPMLVDIAQEFGLDIGTAAMVVVAYMIPFGLFTVIFGPLGDKYGKVRIIVLVQRELDSCLFDLSRKTTNGNGGFLKA